MSALHLEVMLGRLKKRFDVEVVAKPPKIPYKETITTTAQAQYRHKKQTGGRGQYGEVYLKLEPLERGTGFEFVNKIAGGAIPQQYIPAVEKGIREVLDKGVIAGYPVTDVQVTLYDGTFHTVDSSEIAFKIAASRAFQEGFRQARPCLLEPIVLIEVTVPNEFMGDITSDLNGRRGRILGMDSQGDLQVVKAIVPMAEIARYATELRSRTGGQGFYTAEFSHYDVVPQRIQEELQARGKSKED
jgi:elongation factor G